MRLVVCGPPHDVQYNLCRAANFPQYTHARFVRFQHSYALKDRLAAHSGEIVKQPSPGLRIQACEHERPLSTSFCDKLLHQRDLIQFDFNQQIHREGHRAWIAPLSKTSVARAGASAATRGEGLNSRITSRKALEAWTERVVLTEEFFPGVLQRLQHVLQSVTRLDVPARFSKRSFAWSRKCGIVQRPRPTSVAERIVHLRVWCAIMRDRRCG